jgi:hypothetical protein
MRQFDAKWQRIHDEAKTAFGHLVAKRDQRIATLFVDSGFTQQKIADHLGKSHQWVSQRLRFGRFCTYLSTTVAKLPVNLAERRFREFWSEHGGKVTAGTPAETKKFEAIVDSDAWQISMADSPPFDTLGGITENCVDNKWRSLAEIEEAIDVPDDRGQRVSNCITRIQDRMAGGLMVMTKTFAGGVRKHRFKKIKNKDAVKIRAPSVMQEFSPVFDDMDRALSAKLPHDAVPLAKAQMARIRKLYKKYS